MIAAAYQYAVNGGDPPTEIKLASYIDRFGVQAVYGGQIPARVANRIMAAEATVRAYQEMTQADSWASWIAEHPKEAKLLEIGMNYGKPD